MSSVSIGENIKISLFGESHGLAIGGVIDGLPHGQKVDMEKLDKFMARRKPGSGKYVTQRKRWNKIFIRDKGFYYYGRSTGSYYWE